MIANCDCQSKIVRTLFHIFPDPVNDAWELHALGIIQARHVCLVCNFGQQVSTQGLI
jgi:hypothetical protein